MSTRDTDVRLIPLIKHLQISKLSRIEVKYEYLPGYYHLWLVGTAILALTFADSTTGQVTSLTMTIT